MMIGICVAVFALFAFIGSLLYIARAVGND